MALWDNTAQKLYVVRDRLGIKPVYYLARSGNPGMLCFASEIKALLAATGRRTGRSTRKASGSS